MTVSVHKHLDSETIHLPEAAGLVGKDVRITVVEEPLEAPSHNRATWNEIVGKLDLDWDAIEKDIEALRQRSII